MANVWRDFDIGERAGVYAGGGIGAGGYQLGGYPYGWSEWNDQFRDGLRRYWRGDAGMSGDLAKRLLGSAEQFDWGRRAATSSVNFITAHDGFTLQDLVSFTTKRNLAKVNYPANPLETGELGVFREVIRPSYDDAARQQVAAARDATPHDGHALQSLLRGRDTWTVD
jgi:hypothetical protein